MAGADGGSTVAVSTVPGKLLCLGYMIIHVFIPWQALELRLTSQVGLHTPNSPSSFFSAGDDTMMMTDGPG